VYLTPVLCEFKSTFISPYFELTREMFINRSLSFFSPVIHTYLQKGYIRIIVLEKIQIRKVKLRELF